MSGGIISALCIALLLVSITSSQRTGENVQYRPNTCLRGDKHIERPRPEPENENYMACHQWRDAACCTPEFTIQLANTSVNNIDGFHWNRCGDELSSQCRRFFIEIECFYRCSPNIAHFAVTEFPSALANLPICRDYCDSWYEACKNEMTCAPNWITDWVYINGTNHCRDDYNCSLYSTIYQNGQGICEQLWGRSFLYSNSSSTDPDSTRQCLVPYFPANATNPNEVVIQRFFNSASTSLTASTIMILLTAAAAIMSLVM